MTPSFLPWGHRNNQSGAIVKYANFASARAHWSRSGPAGAITVFVRGGREVANLGSAPACPWVLDGPRRLSRPQPPKCVLLREADNKLCSDDTRDGWGPRSAIGGFPPGICRAIENRVANADQDPVAQLDWPPAFQAGAPDLKIVGEWAGWRFAEIARTV